MFEAVEWISEEDNTRSHTALASTPNADGANILHHCNGEGQTHAHTRPQTLTPHEGGVSADSRSAFDPTVASAQSRGTSSNGGGGGGGGVGVENEGDKSRDVWPKGMPGVSLFDAAAAAAAMQQHQHQQLLIQHLHMQQQQQQQLLQQQVPYVCQDSLTYWKERLHTWATSPTLTY